MRVHNTHTLSLSLSLLLARSLSLSLARSLSLSRARALSLSRAVSHARAHTHRLDRGRNFWHDAWVALALVRARRVAGTGAVGEDQVKSLLSQLFGVYGDADGTVWHWAVEGRRPEENVRYCGDNALFHAICSELQWAPEPEGSRVAGEAPSRTQEKINFKKAQKAFWDFVGGLRSRDEDGLASVGDVYPQVRLHPNSELAALLIWRLSC
jgi:hypothetical protein